MPDYTLNDIVDIILVLGEYRCNYQQATELYRYCFPDRQPNDRIIPNKRKWIKMNWKF